jgi:predicted SprT family Zn-dependent metalloprotease
MRHLFIALFTALVVTVSYASVPTNINPWIDENFFVEQDQIEEAICGLRRGDYIVNEELADKVYYKVKDLLMIANKAHPDFYFEYPTISFDIPSGNLQTAGYYDHDAKILLINPLYLNKFGVPFIEDVVTHEVGHLVARVLGSNEQDHHGKDWREVMTKTFKVKNPQPYHHYRLCP